MKENVKKIVRFISAKPIIGWPVRFFVAIVRLPQMREALFEGSHQINAINCQLNEIGHQINEIDHQINEIRHHLHVFDTDCRPLLVESLNYQENLKKSLPVVLRQQVRKSLEREN